ncbi:ABC transporter ATP-binding protein [Chlorobium sp. BLA1]|uniref:ABC transporter ATP-binding protein n=1 Tax=Candidatus Chlorobium masyuteum TaxID=2716876 RepID=UPI0014207EEC|nr:ABC transporter ATP-binding protein [Candidatus Chlorobium masyuteum]NHQ60132.1 ABC transporter ATP-binding protein [Candidatus Chlorobium masyuteum]NTU44599.1 ABC transporter ATP-binding protein [Chlorobiaceae bacterium]
MIEARRISKFFSIVNKEGIAEGLTACLSVTLSIEKGKIITLLGPSGCGKSTFLEILAGLQAPSEGEVYIDGVRVLEPLPSTRIEMEAYRKRYRFLSPLANDLIRDRPKHDIAMIFQDYAVFPWMTVLQNVTFTLKLRGLRRAEREKQAIFYLNKVGLGASLNKYPSQLSGGMRQRLAFARALSVEPKAILMDEPFAAVDLLTRERLQDDLLKLLDSSGITIVMVTHDVAEATYLSDEIIIFSPSPGTIRNRFTIDVPRPRRRDHPELADIQERISRLLKYDIDNESEYSI